MAPSTNNGYVVPNISQAAKNQEDGKNFYHSVKYYNI